MQLREVIRRIQRETGVTTILVTHDQEEALSIADRVARFIGSGAVFSGIAEGGQVRVEHLSLPAQAAAGHAHGACVEMFIRPEKGRLQTLNGTVPHGAVSGEVCESIFPGALTRVRLVVHATKNPVNIWADLASEHAEAFKLGSQVVAQWDADAPRVMADNQP